MRSIGFFGDSFCADQSDQSWCNLLAEKLGCQRPSYYGSKGESIWGTIFNFNHRIRTNTVPDISVFCWTEPYRLYHPRLILTANVVPSKDEDPRIYQALDDYWKYLHNYGKDELAYEYALRHYDSRVLSRVESKIVQTWSFRPFETAKKDAGIRLESGLFIDKSLYKTSLLDQSRDKNINHMSVDGNSKLADEFYKICEPYVNH